MIKEKMIKEKLIKVFLTKEQINLISFLAPHKEKLEIIIASGIFEMQEGSVKYNMRGGYIKNQEITNRKTY